MIQSRTSGQTLWTARERVLHLALRSRSSQRSFKPLFLSDHCTSFSLSSTRHLLKAQISLTFGRAGSCGRSTCLGVPIIGRGASELDDLRPRRFGGKRRIGRRTRVGVSITPGGPIDPDPWRRRASTPATISLGVKSAMGLPWAGVSDGDIFARSGIL